MMSTTTTVDLSFSLRGTTVPRDHGYALYGALSRALPQVHGADWLGIHPLPGTPTDESTLALRPDASLVVRLPADRIPVVLPLAGSTLDVAGAALIVGVPNVHALTPAATLDARLVIVKLTDAPHRDNPDVGRQTLDTSAFADRYLAELARQLEALGIDSLPELHGRRSLTVRGRRLVGYSVRVGALNADQSLTLQKHGLGGKRAMGCGVFRPTRGR